MQKILTLAARVKLDPALYPQLAHQAKRLSDWTALPAQANAHGLGPLLYHHLKAAGVSIPQPVKRELQGLYLRHRHANQVRGRVLAEIVAAFEAAGLQALVLKGAALAHLVYPEPALRPMRDIDLLVRRAEARRAQQLLADLGFNAPVPAPEAPLPGKHLPNATRVVEGLTISVELHHNCFNIGTPASLELDDLPASSLRACPVAGVTARTLPPEEMLWHLCLHLTLIGQPFRLIWLADIVGLAEHFAADINWGRVEQTYPVVLSTLSLFHFITPLSRDLRLAAPLTLGDRPPQGIGREFDGWPRTAIKQQRAAGKSYGQILADTFFPAAWWLRLYYGLGSTRPLFWFRWVRHPLRILSWVGELARQRQTEEQ